MLIKDKVWSKRLAKYVAMLPELQKGLPVAEKYKDVGTADFVTGLLEQHEKISWMLRSSIYYSGTESESFKLA